MTLKKYLDFGIVGALILTFTLGISIVFLFSSIHHLKRH